MVQPCHGKHVYGRIQTVHVNQLKPVILWELDREDIESQVQTKRPDLILILRK